MLCWPFAAVEPKLSGWDVCVLDVLFDLYAILGQSYD